MADTVVEAKETKSVGTPEKKDVDKKIEEVDEDSKTSENGDAEKPKENGTSDEKSEDAKEEVDSAENGDSTDCVEVSAAKRKSGGGDKEDLPAEGASPEKKAKLDEKPVEEAKAANGEAEAAA